jgi:hypothetical protein
MSTLTKPQARAIHALLVALIPDANRDLIVVFNDIDITVTASRMVIVQTEEGSGWHQSIESFALTYNLDDPSLT